MAKAVVTATTLVTDDGVPIDAIHLPGHKDLAIIVAHGFTQSWQRPQVWRIANQFNRAAGVITFDFRGHGRSGGVSTLGDLEIKDLDAAVAYARQLGYARVAAVGFSMVASIVVRPGPLVLPRHQADAPGSLGDRAPARPGRLQADAKDQDQPRRLEADSGPP